ncbi:DUF6924 domain-containing protein [Actinoplanes subtropicus]|uniref:DUF6924 domain-containing protein n=1 Tax=Actinoplanes subtropicus TaxID=543632 RepID=UPI0012F82372|nr:hypothetical protein [Actinoplanes subtropicus]
MNEQMWHLASGTSLVIRADFAHPEAWERLRSAIAEPSPWDGFVAYVEVVDDPADEGLTAARLVETAPPGTDQSFAFLVDTVTLTHPDQPVLVVNLRDGDTFRVVPPEMWSVQNNLSISNMDWAEFAGSVDDDGVFRGFA